VTAAEVRRLVVLVPFVLVFVAGAGLSIAGLELHAATEFDGAAAAAILTLFVALATHYRFFELESQPKASGVDSFYAIQLLLLLLIGEVAAVVAMATGGDDIAYVTATTASLAGLVAGVGYAALHGPPQRGDSSRSDVSPGE
jgi:peptidoglycan/LPS O-acetylase OafA/YrhL